MPKNAINSAWENVVKDLDVISYVNERRIRWSFIIELTVDGRFLQKTYEYNRNDIEKKYRNLCLTSIQLKKILTGIEAVVNLRLLVYVNNEVGHRAIITPMHCLSINARTSLQALMIPEEEDDDPNFRLKERKSAEKLLETWKKRQKHIEHI